MFQAPLHCRAAAAAYDNTRCSETNADRLNILSICGLRVYFKASLPREKESIKRSSAIRACRYTAITHVVRVIAFDAELSPRAQGILKQGTCAVLCCAVQNYFCLGDV